MSSAFSLDGIETAFAAAKVRWTTCDWRTEFGVLKLNLQGLSSVHAERLGKATCGRESQQWLAAATWLRKIEQDAAVATAAAFQACRACRIGDLSLARQKIQNACKIESSWHTELVWEPLRQQICDDGRA